MKWSPDRLHAIPHTVIYSRHQWCIFWHVFLSGFIKCLCSGFTTHPPRRNKGLPVYIKVMDVLGARETSPCWARWSAVQGVSNQSHSSMKPRSTPTPTLLMDLHTHDATFQLHKEINKRKLKRSRISSLWPHGRWSRERRPPSARCHRRAIRRPKHIQMKGNERDVHKVA